MTGCSAGAATIERIYLDYEDGAHIAVTVDDDPAQELFRRRGATCSFAPGLEVADGSEPQRRQRQILVAGVGNAWLSDDGFGGEVGAALDQRPLPPG